MTAPASAAPADSPANTPHLDEPAGPLDRLAGAARRACGRAARGRPVVEHGRDVALVEVAQALDPLAERRLDGDDLDVRVLLLEEPARAHQRAARAEAGDEVGDLRAVLPDLRAGALVVGAGVGVVAVLVEEAPLGVLGGQRLGPLDGAVGALGAGREDDLGAEHLEHLAALDRHVLGQQDLDRVALDAGDRGQGDAGVARRRLEDRLAGTEAAVLLGVLDHRLGDAVLHRPERVLALQLGQDPHVGVGRQTPTRRRSACCRSGRARSR